MIEAILAALSPVSIAISRLGILVWPAYITAAGFGALWLWRGGRPVALAALLWAAYAAYETLMSLRILCSGDCNIRIDLLLFYPILLIVGVAAILSTFWARPSPR